MHMLHSVADCVGEPPGRPMEYTIALARAALREEHWRAFLASLPKFQTIKELDLSGTDLDDWRCEELCQVLLTNPSPQTSLRLSNNMLGPFAADAIAAFVSDDQWLEELHMASNQLTNIGATLIAEAAYSHARLSTIDFSENELTDTDVQPFIYALQQIPNLTTLTLRGNDLGDAAAFLLSNMLATSGLTSLDLSYNSVGSEGCSYLAMAVCQRSRLAKLSLAQNCVGENGAKALLTAMRPGSSLTNLDVSGNCISAAMCLRLVSEATEEYSMMTSLNVANNALSMDDCGALFGACHGSERCTVVFAPAGGDLMYTQHTWAQHVARSRGKKPARQMPNTNEADAPQQHRMAVTTVPKLVYAASTGNLPDSTQEVPMVSMAQLHRAASHADTYMYATDISPRDAVNSPSTQGNCHHSTTSSILPFPRPQPTQSQAREHKAGATHQPDQHTNPGNCNLNQGAVQDRLASYTTQTQSSLSQVQRKAGSPPLAAAAQSRRASQTDLPHLASSGLMHQPPSQPSTPYFPVPVTEAPAGFSYIRSPPQGMDASARQHMPSTTEAFRTNACAPQTFAQTKVLKAGPNQNMQQQGQWLGGHVPLRSVQVLQQDPDVATLSETSYGTPGLSVSETRSTAPSSSHTDPLPVKNGMGQPIKKGHPNFDLMRNIQTGLGHGVQAHSKCERRPLDRDEDFQNCKVKYLIKEGHGGEPVEFTDYAPVCFLKLREIFGLDPDDYVRQLCSSDWTESPAGKSSALLYFAGNCFVIKTTVHEESKFLRRLLFDYYEHCEAYPLTLIPHFFGHHAIKLPGRKKIRFVIMNNVFNTTNEIHIKYDLKGSKVGRTAKIKSANSAVILKDQDMLENKDWMHLGRKKEILMRQIRADTRFLASQSIMDYSFLLGIHKMGSETDTSGFTPLVAAEHVRSREEYCFLADCGGMRREGEDRGEIYYFGIIDILQEYTLRKRGETIIRSVQHGKKGISAVPPDYYAIRFSRFLSRIMV